MFWRGLPQTQHIEQILDKEQYTLEELLDEEDLVQECKALNGRLVSFLRERRTVEQLIRYLVEPQDDSDDPKRTYKYPFASCEVLCCELDPVYATLVADHELMQLLFSPLNSTVPLQCKYAGYFGRVVCLLLLRKSSEMLAYLQGQGTELLVKLVNHIAITSIADVMKRMIGADDQSSLMPSPAMGQWLAKTPLIDLLLAQLDEGHNSDAQSNAADILASAAHTQPTPLATRLTEPSAIAALVDYALAPGRQVLVPALDVCIALLQPRRGALGSGLDTGMEPLGAEAASHIQARGDAVLALVQHLPRLVDLLSLELSGTAMQETSYGVLVPPLGRHRLKVVELLVALVRSGSDAVEQAVIQSSALTQCMNLFSRFPFNNLLHHNVAVMLVTCMSCCSEAMTTHLFEDCKVLDWMMGLPDAITPTPRVGTEEVAAAKAPLRAGYLGHITQIALALAGHLAPDAVGSSVDGSGAASQLCKYVSDHEAWKHYFETVVLPQQELENTQRWECGRPVAQTILGMDSDGDDFSSFEALDDLDKYGEPGRNPWGEEDLLAQHIAGTSHSESEDRGHHHQLPPQGCEDWEEWTASNALMYEDIRTPGLDSMQLENGIFGKYQGSED